MPPAALNRRVHGDDLYIQANSHVDVFYVVCTREMMVRENI